jgi:uncharacterized membrane protein
LRLEVFLVGEENFEVEGTFDEAESFVVTDTFDVEGGAAVLSVIVTISVILEVSATVVEFEIFVASVLVVVDIISDLIVVGMVVIIGVPLGVSSVRLILLVVDDKSDNVGVVTVALLAGRGEVTILSFVDKLVVLVSFT